MKDYSKTWIIIGYLVPGIWLLVFELLGLRHADDRHPTITSLAMIAIRSKWWAAAMVFGFLVWLFTHFMRRL